MKAINDEGYDDDNIDLKSPNNSSFSLSLLVLLQNNNALPTWWFFYSSFSSFSSFVEAASKEVQAETEIV